MRVTWQRCGDGRSGLTGPTSIRLLFLFTVSLSLIVLRHTDFLEIRIFKSCAAMTLRTKTWQEFPALRWMCGPCFTQITVLMLCCYKP